MAYVIECGMNQSPFYSPQHDTFGGWGKLQTEQPNESFEHDSGLG